MSETYRYVDSNKRLGDAAEDITNSMDWEETAEGYEYWADVYHRLIEHATEAGLYPGTGVAQPRYGSTPVTVPGVQKGYSQKTIQVTHVMAKDSVTSALCGLTLEPKIPAPTGHGFVALKDKEKVTCVLCKSKLLF